MVYVSFIYLYEQWQFMEKNKIFIDLIKSKLVNFVDFIVRFSTSNEMLDHICVHYLKVDVNHSEEVLVAILQTPSAAVVYNVSPVCRFRSYTIILTQPCFIYLLYLVVNLGTYLYLHSN